MVRLKVMVYVDDMYKSPNFNSTMVRLKAGIIPLHHRPLELFQFHYGTIKSRRFDD